MIALVIKAHMIFFFFGGGGGLGGGGGGGVMILRELGITNVQDCEQMRAELGAPPKRWCDVV
jgi:hypothetical protein